jgi:hypothetical protein
LHAVIHKLKVNDFVAPARHSFLLLESTSHDDYTEAPNFSGASRLRAIRRRAFGFSMSERRNSPYDSVARRWLALIERRQEHLIELCDTGRWRHYYTQVEFLDEMRKVLHVRDQWAAIADVAPERERSDRNGYDMNPSPDLRIGPAIGRSAMPMSAPSWPDWNAA